MERKGKNFVGNRTIICNDKLSDLSIPKVMGIVNLTPNSFYEGSRSEDVESALKRVERMIDNGVDILDVGGISTQPNANLLTEKVEIQRILPVIKSIREKYPNVLISVDTFRAAVALKAVEAGANMVNDVYGGRYDARMIEVVTALNVPYIVMHSRGEASNMQSLTNYTDVVEDVFLELSERIYTLRKKGVKDVIVDLGFGFAKTLQQNYQLMKCLNYFKLLNCPMLVGISRKSMIYDLLKINPAEALNGTSVLNTIAIFTNAQIIRVHDVKEAKELLAIKSAIEG